jgi:hypothetical protein
MALLAEQLVEEWLNRQGYFTMRGMKNGVHEIDLLGIKPLKQGGHDARHYEVQVSFRPVSFITPLTAALQKTKGKKASSSVSRSDEDLGECVSAWVEKKYTSSLKNIMRDRVLNDVSWDHYFIHGKVKDARELGLIRRRGVKLVSFKDVVADLCKPGSSWAGSIATDIAEIVKFHAAD